MTKKILVLVLLSAGLVFAQEGPLPGGPGGPPPRRGPGMMGPMGGMMPMMRFWKESRIANLLGLSQQQIDQLDQVVDSNEPQLKQMSEQLRTNEDQLHKLMDADQPDTAQINSQIDQIAQMRASLEKATAKMHLAVRGILTPDQWKKLQAEMMNIHERMQQRMQRREGRPSQEHPQGPEGEPQF